MRALLITLVLLAWGVAEALTPGGGSPSTDCLAEFGGTPANYPSGRPRDIRCEDGDPGCDGDPVAGACRFEVEACFNVNDPNLPSCAPKELDGYGVENPQPDTNPLHDFDLQSLQDLVMITALPVDADNLNVCSGTTTIGVPLSIRLRSGGARYKRGRKTIRTTVTGPGGIADDDRMRLTCIVPDGADACAGVTSTFDQIQKHVFVGRSCSRSTCHNVAQAPHDLSLEVGEAHASLVGVAPTNGIAAAAGKLRVDPGNPANSFIVDKLRGRLALGEGARMPFGLRRLRTIDIRVVEEWIAAGAPATGFVAPSGCQP